MNIFLIIKKHYLWLIIPAILFMLAFLIFPAFNIIDDGASLFSAQKLSENISYSNWSNILIENEVGRLRPFYHLYFFILYNIAGTHPLFYWIAQAFVLSFTLIAMALFLYKSTKKYWLAGILPVSLLLFSPTAENFYRLGTAETKQMLIWSYLLVILANIKKDGFSIKKIIALGLLFISSILFKETSLIFLTSIGVFCIWNYFFGKNQRALNMSIVLFFLVIGTIFAINIPKGNYSSGFQISITNIWNNFLIARLEYTKIFFPFLVSLFATANRFYFQIIEKRINLKLFFWQILLSTQLATYFILGILPWQHQLPRYFYPIYLIAILYIAIESSYWVDLIKKNNTFYHQKIFHSFTCLSILLSILQVKLFQTAININFSLKNIVHQFSIFLFEDSHIIFFLLAGIAVSGIRLCLINVFRKKLKLSFNDFRWQLQLIILTFISIITTKLIWSTVATKTEFIIILPIIIYWIIEIQTWITQSTELWYKKVGKGPLLTFIIIAAFSVIFSNNFLFVKRGSNLGEFVRVPITLLTNSFDIHQVSYALISHLLKTTEPETQVFVIADDYEIIFEIGLYSSNLGKRPVKIFTTNKKLVDDVGVDFPNVKYIENPIEGYLATSGPKVLLLRKIVWEIFW